MQEETTTTTTAAPQEGSVGRVSIPNTNYTFSRISYGTLHFPEFESEWQAPVLYRYRFPFYIEKLLTIHFVATTTTTTTH